MDVLLFYSQYTLTVFSWSCCNQPFYFRANVFKQLTFSETSLTICINTVTERSQFKVKKLYSQSHGIYLSWHSLSGSTELNPDRLAGNSKRAASAEVPVGLP